MQSISRRDFISAAVAGGVGTAVNACTQRAERGIELIGKNPLECVEHEHLVGAGHITGRERPASIRRGAVRMIIGSWPLRSGRAIESGHPAPHARPCGPQPRSLGDPAHHRVCRLVDSCHGQTAMGRSGRRLDKATRFGAVDPDKA